MNFKVYIQFENGFPIADWASDAYIGFQERGMEIIPFEDIEEVPQRKNTIVVSYIEDTIKYLNRIGIEVPKPLNIPECLVEFARREYNPRINTSLVKSQIGLRFHLPFFIKPADRAKEFLSGIITKTETLQCIPDDKMAFVSQLVNIVSEYRVYVYDNKIQGINWYQGDFSVFPTDFNMIEKIQKSYIDAPAGYSIDIGILDDGSQVLIECNDGWSLGNYGLEPKKYATLLLKRWLELTQ